MYKTLKKMSFRAILPTFIILLVFAVAALAITAPCLVSMLNVRPGLDESVSSGDMVRFDSMMVVAGFATVSNANGKTVQTYYMLDLGNGKFMAMKASPKYDSSLNRALAQSESYYHTHAIDTLSPMGEICGSVMAMDSETYSFLEQGLASAELEGDIFPYTIMLGYVGTLPNAWFTVLLCVGIALLLAAGVLAALCFSGFYHRYAREFVESRYSQEEAEADFEKATVLDNVRLGDRLLWYQTGARIYCAAVDSLLWGFERIDARMTGARRYSLYLYDSNGVCHDIHTKTAQERRPLADAIAEKGHPFIFGYSQERAGLFARDRAAFKRMAEAEIRK